MGAVPSLTKKIGNCALLLKNEKNGSGKMTTLEKRYKVIELFSGIGSQRMALNLVAERTGLEFDRHWINGCDYDGEEKRAYCQGHPHRQLPRGYPPEKGVRISRPRKRPMGEDRVQRGPPPMSKITKGGDAQKGTTPIVKKKGNDIGRLWSAP